MSKLNFSHGKLARFLSSKGFYAAVAACLLGAGGATWLAVSETVTSVEEQSNELIESENEWTNYPEIEVDIETGAEPVEQKQEGILKPPERTEATTPTEPSKQLSSPSQPSPSSGSESGSGGGSEQGAQSVALPVLSYVLPVRDDILGHYSAGELVRNETLGDWRTHDGIDVAAEAGVEVLASASGEVVSVAEDALWGTVITLAHADGRETLYYGLSDIIPVKEGEAVLQSQVIGTVDAIPCEIKSPSHLHFAMREGGIWMDPLETMQ